MVLAIAAVVLIIFLFGQASFYLSRIADGTLSVNFFLRLMLLNIPFLLSFILPFAFYFGVLLAYSRLYADSEMVVLQASGFSIRRLLGYTLCVAALVFVLVAYLNLFLAPKIIEVKGKILQSGQHDVMASIIPGDFKILNHGEQILYAKDVGRSKHNLKDVFVAELTENKPARWRVSYVKSARQVEYQASQYLKSQQVFQYQGSAGQGDFKIGYAKVLMWLLKAPDVSYGRLDGAPSSQLWRDRQDLAKNVELQWRIGLVLQVLVLALLVVPLAKVQPRQGRYGKFLPALLLYMLYAVLLTMGRSFMADGILPASLGLWWVHAVMLLLVVIFYVFNYGLVWRR